MKKMIIAVCLLAIAAAASYAADLVVQADVSVSTTPTLVKGITGNRKMFRVKNVGSEAIRVSSYPALVGMYLSADEAYVDNFYVLSSSIWAVCVSTNGSTANYIEKR